jgi:uncharacterized protein YoaH (UPF0181 family)
MHASTLSLSHSEQQEAVERIHQLMAKGMGSSEAIACVAQEIRKKYKSEHVTLLFEDKEYQSHW